MNQVEIASVVLVDTREMLLHAMMAFVCVRDRHNASADFLNRAEYQMSVSAYDAGHNHLLQALDAWVTSGSGGFEQLHEHASAWAAMVARLDASPDGRTMREASDAFNALAREAVLVANVVAAVN